ncbi:MAG: PEP-CTERM sorting domain-containing protein [Verrucomicrobiota bacterium]|jgi:hypothetical protein
MKTLKVLFLCSAAFLLTLFQSPAQELLSLNPVNPDLDAEQVTVSYSGGTFNAGGASPPVLLGYTDPNGNSWGESGSGSFVVTANINSSGNLTSGSLTVNAFLAENDPASLAVNTVYVPTLLTATLMTGLSGSPPGSAPVGSAWDYANYYDDPSDPSSFEGTQFAFSFTVTGGILAGDYGGIGSSGVIELFPNGDDPFYLTTSYSNGGAYGACDIFPVPEPSSNLLFLIGGAVWLVARRCHRSTLSV